MPLTKVTGKGITCSAVTEDKIGASAVTTNKINNDAVTSAKISNGAVTADDLASTLDLSSKTVTLPSNVVAAAKRPVQDNIALLGFKMAVNDGLTIFNLVDGVVDEFNDESGTDEAEGTNDFYCGTDDVYSNNSTPLTYSAGFTVNSITEPDTSAAGTNPSPGSGTFGTFTVPSGVPSISLFTWGAGGGNEGAAGGGGGFSSGTLAVTPGQVLEIVVGEGGHFGSEPGRGTFGSALGGGGTSPNSSPYAVAANGGGLSGIFTDSEGFPALQDTAPKAPQVFMVAAGGGGAGFAANSGGGAGGGLTGDAGGTPATEQTSQNGPRGGGGSQSAGGQGGQTGKFLLGGAGTSGDGFKAGGGGGGYYGGGGGAFFPNSCVGGGSGGGGSSYYGHPQITSGATEEGALDAGGGTASPLYIAGTNEGATSEVGQGGPLNIGEDGYVLITACVAQFAQPGGGATTIVSQPFTSTTVPTTSRIVVFEENVDTPTLNTDIIASISRDGTNFTNATLSDSGYVTGSSGQRILTGQADISGQPSGQSMRWKLALANNTVKIHGVALQWS